MFGDLDLEAEERLPPSPVVEAERVRLEQIALAAFGVWRAAYKTMHARTVPDKQALQGEMRESLDELLAYLGDR